MESVMNDKEITKKIEAEAKKLIDEGDCFAAFALFRQAIIENPENLDLYWAYYICLEDFEEGIPEYVGDMLTCRENMHGIIMRDQIKERMTYMDAKYTSLAQLYFQYHDYENSLKFVRQAMELGANRETEMIYESYSLYRLGLDIERKYEKVCEMVVKNFCDSVSVEAGITISGATEEQLSTLKGMTDFELPIELMTYFRFCMPEQRIPCSKKAFLLSFEDICNFNQSYLVKIGFFAFAMTQKGDLLYLDLKDTGHAIYQISTEVCREDGIYLPISPDSVIMPLSYENVKMVSFMKKYHLLFALPDLRSKYMCIYKVDSMVWKYELRKELEEKEYSRLMVAISEEPSVKSEAPLANNSKNEKQKDEMDVELKKQYEAIMEKVCEKICMNYAKKSLEIAVKKEKPELLDCKLGGIPFVPANGQLPVDLKTGEPLFLLAQINFAQIPHLPNYPAEGILQFFVGADDVYGVNFDDGTDQTSWRVLYYDDLSNPMSEEEVNEAVKKSLQKKDMYLPFEKPGETYSLEFTEKEMLLPIGDYRFEEDFFEVCKELWPEEFGEIKNEFDLPDKFRDMLYEVFDGFGSRIGGYPGFTQFDPREYDDALKEYELLLQFDSIGDDDGGILTWGDFGIGNFFIKPQDLQNKDFSRVIYNWDCY